MAALLIAVSKKECLSSESMNILQTMKQKYLKLLQKLDRTIHQEEYVDQNVSMLKLWFDHSYTQNIARNPFYKTAGICVGNPYHEKLHGLPKQTIAQTILDEASITHSFLYELHAPFNAAIYHLQDKSFEIITDRPGLHHLYVAEDNDAYYFSNSAISLAYGLKATYDLEGLTTFFMSGYLMNQKSMFQGIRKIQGGASISISGSGKFSEFQYWVPPDEDKTLTNIRGVAKAFSNFHREAIDKRIAEETKTTLELTAGYDTRLNLISALKTQKPFLAWTIGEPDCFEVQIGKKMQSVKQFDHQIMSLSCFENEFYEKFQEDFDLLVSLTDGESNSLNLIASPICNRHSDSFRKLSISGLAGEIIRGVNYPFFKKEQSSDIGINLQRYLTLKTIHQNIGDLSVFSPQLLNDVKKFIHDSVKQYFTSNQKKPYHWRLDNYYFQGPSQRFVGRTCTLNNYYYRMALPYYCNETIDLSFRVPHEMKAYGRLFLQTFYEAGPEFSEIRLANGLPARPLKFKDSPAVALFLSKTAKKILKRIIIGKTGKRKKSTDSTGIGKFVENKLFSNNYLAHILDYDNLHSSFLYDPDSYKEFIKSSYADNFKHRAQIGMMMTIESLCRIMDE